MVQPTPYININIFMLKINSFENASAVNVGQNLLAEWQNSDKKSRLRTEFWRCERIYGHEKPCG